MIILLRTCETCSLSILQCQASEGISKLHVTLEPIKENLVTSSIKGDSGVAFRTGAPPVAKVTS